MRERTSYLKIVDGEIEDVSKDGGWVDIFETKSGGAQVKIAGDLVLLDRINSKMQKMGRYVELEICEKGGGVIIVDENGKQIPFEVVMKAIND